MKPKFYVRLLNGFHSSGIQLDAMTRLWVQVVLQHFPGALRVGGRLVLVGDGIKIPKCGRKMPAVKLLHQESDSNTEPEFIMGHSFQAVALLVSAARSTFAVPLASRIHEGGVLSNRDKRTLLDKRVLLLDSLCIQQHFYFVADAYYASGKVIRGLLREGNHLVTRAKSNAVPLLDARHEAPSTTKPKPVPAPGVVGISRPCQKKDRRLPPLRPRRHRRPGNLAVPLLLVPQTRVARLWILAAHDPIRHPTFRPPSERVCAAALRNELPDFLIAGSESMIFAKSITDRIDLNRSEGLRLTG